MEFRGYLCGEVSCTFPANWIESIELVGSIMQVNYYDKINKTDGFVLVDEIKFK